MYQAPCITSTIIVAFASRIGSCAQVEADQRSWRASVNNGPAELSRLTGLARMLSTPRKNAYYPASAFPISPLERFTRDSCSGGYVSLFSIGYFLAVRAQAALFCMVPSCCSCSQCYTNMLDGCFLRLCFSTPSTQPALLFCGLSFISFHLLVHLYRQYQQSCTLFLMLWCWERRRSLAVLPTDLFFAKTEVLLKTRCLN